jgi:hypothetical protein
MREFTEHEELIAYLSIIVVRLGETPETVRQHFERMQATLDKPKEEA